MNLVINLSEDEYKHIMEMQFCIPGIRSGKSLLEKILNAIRTGTPLPKGHGRLFDEDELKKEAIRCEWSRQVYDMIDHKLSYMKPIIEADTDEGG